MLENCESTSVLALLVLTETSVSAEDRRSLSPLDAIEHENAEAEQPEHRVADENRGESSRLPHKDGQGKQHHRNSSNGLNSVACSCCEGHEKDPISLPCAAFNS